MAWYSYRFWGSHNGESYSDVTDIAPHPSWSIRDAVAWALHEVEVSGLTRYRYLELQRRQGSYRPRGAWKTLAWWRFGKWIEVGAVARLKMLDAAAPKPDGKRIRIRPDGTRITSKEQ